MKKVILLLLVWAMNAAAHAQTSTIDSLELLLQKEKTDTGRVILLIQLSSNYFYHKPDTALHLRVTALELSRRSNFLEGEAHSLNGIGFAYGILGNYPKALEAYLQAMKINEKTNNLRALGMNLNNIGNIYRQQGKYKQALQFYIKGRKLLEPSNNEGLAVNLGNMGRCYLELKKHKTAIKYTQQAYEITKKHNYHLRTGNMLLLLGTIYSRIDQKELALQYYRQSIPYAKQVKNEEGLSDTFLGMAQLFEKAGQMDSTLLYANQAFKLKKSAGFKISDASNFLYSFYNKRGNADSALLYLEIAKAANDSLFSKERINQMQSIEMDEKIRQKDLEAERSRNQNRIRLYALFFAVIVILLVAIFLFRNNKQKQQVNVVLQAQKEKTEKAYEQLKATQAQLIQSEKMASLGELIAGIAHEIQNPLNFVNNFSEVSAELTAELKEELKSGNTEEAISLADDLKQNLQKITHHGKRADFIIKGMLQHSRASTGDKQATNLNALADEYLRLSYHGLRAKDKSFNAEIITHFDEHLSKVNVVPQDLGRVLLNLFNNAFYAVAEKKKILNGAFEPKVWVETKQHIDHTEIRVRDNGIGIPENIKNKILQPFFTTKPTGQGTGLGLSMSYDIITKGHGGTIEINTIEGEFSEFILRLPRNNG